MNSARKGKGKGWPVGGKRKIILKFEVWMPISRSKDWRNLGEIPIYNLAVCDCENGKNEDKYSKINY